MFDGQMEMSFGRINSVNRRQQAHANRAQWWFRRMRQIVDLAIDWQPTPAPRPVQIWFPANENRPKASILRRKRRAGVQEHQICE